MQLKFCVNINKTLEVIRILVMTVFLCHPVHEPQHQSNLVMKKSMSFDFDN